MRLPKDTVIAPSKLINYLLLFRPVDDKSKFLAQAGYSVNNWTQLEADLRRQILPLEAVSSQEPNRFGDVCEIRGALTGPNRVMLRVVTVWMTEYQTGQTKFITLYPNKEGR
jgi:hypothetical protein